MVAFVVGAIWSIDRWTKKLADNRRMKVLTTTVEARINSSTSGADTNETAGPGFIEVIWLYLVAMKQKVCPTIEFKTIRRQGGV